MYPMISTCTCIFYGISSPYKNTTDPFFNICIFPLAEFFIIGERFVEITRQLKAAEVLSKLSTMNNTSSFVKDPLVITKQLKLYFSDSSRIPTQYCTIPVYIHCL
jgi:hypothetical protein